MILKLILRQTTSSMKMFWVFQTWSGRIHKEAHHLSIVFNQRNNFFWRTWGNVNKYDVKSSLYIMITELRNWQIWFKLYTEMLSDMCAITIIWCSTCTCNFQSLYTHLQYIYTITNFRQGFYFFWLRSMHKCMLKIVDIQQFLNWFKQ